MRIAIVGGGGGGLAAAWLLGEDHSVTLFEREERLGGHAHTIEVDAGGVRVPIDAGFEFLSDVMFPTFTRLLDLLGVERIGYQTSATFVTAGGRVTLMPPFRDRRILWEGLRPRALAELVQLQWTLHRLGGLMGAGDTSRTLQSVVERLHVSSAFRERFLLPFLLSGWCVEPGEFREFMAYDTLRYVYMHRSLGLRAPRMSDIVGGTRRYVDALVATLPPESVQTGVAVRRIAPGGEGGLELRGDGGSLGVYDQVVVATNAAQAHDLLGGVDTAAPLRAALSGIEYFRTAIAIHGDVRLMPRDRRHWSVVNVRHDGVHSATTVWKPWRGGGAPVFKSWITYEPAPPEPLHAIAEYDHPKVDRAYFDTQRTVAALQGREGVWIAGLYAHDVDCHESAVLSAANIAHRLAPGGTRLRRLDDRG